MSEANLLQTPVSEQDSCWADKLYTAGLFLFAFTCNFSISAAQISLGLALIGFIGLYRAGKTAVRATPLDKPLAFFVFAGILSVFRAEDLSLALIEMKSYLVIFCFYLVYWHSISEATLKRILGVFISSACLIGIINGLTMPFQNISAGRAKGFFSISMTFGECQALSLLVAVFLFGLIFKNFTVRALILLAALTSAYSVTLSMVRSAWLGVLAGLSVILVSYLRQTVFVTLIILVAIAPLIFVSTDIQDRFTGLNPKLIAEIATGQMCARLNTSAALQASFHRLTIWWRGFIMTEDNFLFGVGLNNVETVYKRLADESEKKQGLIWGHQHNNFMQFFVSTGFIGLIAFFYFIITALKFFAQPSKTSISSWGHSLSRCSLAVFIGFIAFGTGEFSWADEEVAMMTFFITGLMMNGHPKDYASPASPLATS